MQSSKKFIWKKIENENGYPFYINESTNEGNFNHPDYEKLMSKLIQHNQIKYTTYRMAFKVWELQKYLNVPALNISMGVLARHCLSISESSLTLEPCELEAVLTDIYFAGQKDGCCTVDDIDIIVDIIVNLLLNIYDSFRKTPIRVLSVKCLLILLCKDNWVTKRQHLLSLSTDHNHCVNVRRLTSLLETVAMFAQGIGETTLGLNLVKDEVDKCFQKAPGMLGLSEYAVQKWLEAEPTPLLLSWLPVCDRIQSTRMTLETQYNDELLCTICDININQMLLFVCSKCNDVYLCERCYLHDSVHSAHIVNEIYHQDVLKQKPSILKFANFFSSCTRRQKKVKQKKKHKTNKQDENDVDTNERKANIVTSTLGKASGNKVGRGLENVLRDIIDNLEIQNRALKELSNKLQCDKTDVDYKIQYSMEKHWSQIAKQINRLKTLQDNVCLTNDKQSGTDSGMQAFDLLSPIQPVNIQKVSKLTSSDTNKNPRVLSLDSGNFTSQSLMVMSGDQIKPVIAHATTDSISTVSMNDISTWLGDSKSPNKGEHNNEAMQANDLNESINVCAARYDDDVKSLQHSDQCAKEANADLDTVLDRLHKILAANFTLDESTFDNTQLKETADEMEGLLGTLIRGVEQRQTYINV